MLLFVPNTFILFECKRYANKNAEKVQKRSYFIVLLLDATYTSCTLVASFALDATYTSCTLVASFALDATYTSYTLVVSFALDAIYTSNSKKITSSFCRG